MALRPLARQKDVNEQVEILGRLTVLPVLPERIGRLDEIANNLWWTWVPEARNLFRLLDRDLWRRVQDSPVAFLREVSQQVLDDAATDEEFLGNYDSVLTAFDSYMLGSGERSRELAGDTYAYFCAEYGWHESIPVYSGGLGILAGDHTKAASDLGVPLVGIGLWYPDGYFHQRLGSDGRQKAIFERRSPGDLPMTPVRDGDGNDITVSVNVYGHDVHIRCWQVRVGRISVYLLDVDFDANASEQRQLLLSLYGGDERTRIAQEMILGVGGVRMLRRLGIEPDMWHMNEGHSAFMVLERSRELVSQGMDFAAAREAVTAGTLFTVHTPVAAGNDAFDFALVHECLTDMWTQLGLSRDEFDALGVADHGWGDVFSMPALAIRFSSRRNGVAQLHGETSRRIWSHLWPAVPLPEVPITHVTNGVHRGTWLARDIQKMLDEHLGQDWRDSGANSDLWAELEQVPAAGFWQVRQAMKRQSLRFLRRRLASQLRRQHASHEAVEHVSDLFNADALTIGFARRFATYKRATLILQDLDRLERLLNNPDRPVQLVFAGKAHPADKPGQELIRRIDELSRDPRFERSILFVEDYDMAVGRALTRGVDVWLNNPRRPLEASGTSGEKAAMNGVLNLSVLDGWWPEGFDGFNGWAFGWTEPYTDTDVVDRSDAAELMDLLEDEVVPLFYDRDGDGLPQGWIDRSRRAIMTIAPQFSARRMVTDYVDGLYRPLAERQRQLFEDGHAAARELAGWRSTTAGWWDGLTVEAEVSGEGRLDREHFVRARVSGAPEDARLSVQLLYRHADATGEDAFEYVELSELQASGGDRIFEANFLPGQSGSLVYGVRVQPVNELAASRADAGFVTWASSAG